mgnify:CR=1 FL=1
MNYPYDQIELELLNLGWKIESKNQFQSTQNWFAKEIWIISRYDTKLYLNYLNDPMEISNINEIWAISFTNLEPKSRSEAEQGIVITINKELISSLKTKMK